MEELSRRSAVRILDFCIIPAAAAVDAAAAYLRLHILQTQKKYDISPSYRRVFEVVSC